MSITKIKNFSQFVNENLNSGSKALKGKRIFEAVDKVSFKRDFLGNSEEFGKYLDSSGHLSLVSANIFLDSNFFKLLDKTENGLSNDFNTKLKKYLKTETDGVLTGSRAGIVWDNENYKFTKDGLLLGNGSLEYLKIRPIQGGNYPSAIKLAPTHIKTLEITMEQYINSNWSKAFENCTITNLIVQGLKGGNFLNLFSGDDKYFKNWKLQNIKTSDVKSLGGLFRDDIQSPYLNLNKVEFGKGAFSSLVTEGSYNTMSVFKSRNVTIDDGYDGDVQLKKLEGDSKLKINTDDLTIVNIAIKDKSGNYTSNTGFDLSFIEVSGKVKIDNFQVYGGGRLLELAGLPTSKTNSVTVGDGVKVKEGVKKIGTENVAPEGGQKVDDSYNHRTSRNFSLNEAKSCKGKVVKFLKDNDCVVDYEAGTCKEGTKTMKIEKALLKFKAPESLIKSYTQECTKEVNEALRLRRNR